MKNVKTYILFFIMYAFLREFDPLAIIHLLVDSIHRCFSSIIERQFSDGSFDPDNFF